MSQRFFRLFGLLDPFYIRVEALAVSRSFPNLSVQLRASGGPSMSNNTRYKVLRLSSDRGVLLVTCSQLVTLHSTKVQKAQVQKLDALNKRRANLEAN